MIPHCSFELHFFNKQRCWASFLVPVGHIYPFCWEMSIETFCLLFHWVVLILSCMSCLYILEITPFICKYFLPFCRLSFPVYGSCVVQKLLSLIWSHLFNFIFISITLGDRFKKILLQFKSKSVLPMFFSRSFIVSGLNFSL